MEKKLKKVVVIGAGFAGISVLSKLAKSEFFDCTIISAKSHFEYYPGLYRVMGKRLPFEVFVPFRYMLDRHVRFFHEQVTTINTTEKKVVLNDGQTIDYDILIVATGMTITDFGIPGVFAYGQFVTSLASAKLAKQTLCEKLTQYSTEALDQENKNENTPKNPFIIIIAGAGPTGVELAGELATHINYYVKENKLDKKDYGIKIIQRDKTILPMLSQKVQDKALARLKKIGVTVLVEHTITSVNETSVMTDTSTEPYSLFFFTAGSKQSDLVLNTPGFTLSPRKKVIVDENFRAQGMDNVYVLGDNAETALSGLAQIAEADGAYLGRFLVASHRGMKIPPYKQRKPLFVIPVGDYWGIFGAGDTVISGFLPWILRYAVDMRFFFFHLSTKDFLTLSLRRRLE